MMAPLTTEHSALIACPLVLVLCGPAAAQSIPTDLQLPGTQPNEISELESPNKCDNCHGGYDAAVEPAFNWRGSMMAHSVRDPLFWATVAISEQDFPGSGDLCIRCHSPEGWLGGRSTPTDGSALKETDAAGVMCDACHQMVDPSGTEHAGAQSFPFLAHDTNTPAKGYYGSSMLVLSPDGNTKFGPYDDAPATHPSLASSFHRRSDFCGSCHDVSNPVVGDLAPGNGAQLPLAPGTFSGTPGTPVEGKAAFQNFPFAYGTVERTYSEHAAGLLSQTRVADFPGLPSELRQGSILAAYQAAIAAGPDGDYADGTTRLFSCQTCHMPPVTGKGCDKSGAPVRSDLPLHDLTGGNTWVPAAIQYLDGEGDLILGGGLSEEMKASLDAGAQRAAANLQAAASLEVLGDSVRIVNLTGHKLLTGFPEGRRMWLNVRWYDTNGTLLREDGEYGDLQVQHDEESLTVRTILDATDPNSHVVEAHLGMTQAWAAKLVGLGWDGALVLDYDDVTGAPGWTLQQLADEPAGTVHETFHFVLNDTIVSDNRIPPYGYDYDEALKRSALPVPDTQFGDPGPGGTFEHWADVPLDPPSAAVSAEVDLLYQTTSWEYVQFLSLADQNASAHLAEAPDDLFEAWLNTGMAEPVVMASAEWTGIVDCNGNGVDDAQDIADGTSLDCNGNGVPDECEPAQETIRLGVPPNPMVFLPGVTSGPVVGATWDPVVDHSGFVPDALIDYVGITALPANVPVPGLGTLLCDLSGAVVSFSTLAGLPFSIPIPNSCNLVGVELCAQAAALGGSQGTVLTNALDITVGAP